MRGESSCLTHLSADLIVAATNSHGERCSPDTFSPEFAAEARRQSLIVANSPHAEEDQAFVDSISHWPE